MLFCERLASLLEEKRISKKDFLANCGLGRNSFSNWAKSQTGYPTLPVLKVISDYLGVSIEYLKGETDERGTKNSSVQMSDEGVRKEIVDMINGMSDTQLKKLLPIIQAVKEIL